MKRINKLLLATSILFLLSICCWGLYSHRINEASQYEDHIMEERKLFRKQAQRWIMNHEPEVYDNSYDIIAICLSCLGILTLIIYAVQKHDES
jgi:hypothetical protein